MKHHTTVRSDLAKADARDQDSARCPSTYTAKRDLFSVPAGTILRCSRPASRHRVHEALGYIQW